MHVKKVCLLGNFSVGKTSLVRRYVTAQFDEKYRTTVGVAIDTKLVEVNDEVVKLVIWDIEGGMVEGQGELPARFKAYLNGVAGLIFVADGTRPNTLTDALSLYHAQWNEAEPTPAILFLNKFDLRDDWELDETAKQQIPTHIPSLTTSAKTGENVEQGFAELTRMMLE